jgi:DNA processing protein
MAMLSVKGFGIQTLQKLLKYYGSVGELVERVCQDKVFEDTGLKVTKHLHQALMNFDGTKYKEALGRESVEVLSFEDVNYPQNLKGIENFPPVLHYKGNINKLNTLPGGIAVVGSRRISSYGKRVAFDIGRFLGRYKLPVISGLAYGVDYEVHRGVIHSSGLPFAVLANGLETIYPKEHKKIAKEIQHRGALITEEFLYSELANYKFPIRNRLISGLAQVIVVVEAEEKSGSLITAQHGLDQGKTVFAVPGSIYSPTSKGTNQLIADGAIPLLTLNQLLDEYSNVEQVAETVVRDSAYGKEENDVSSFIINVLKEKSPLDCEALSRCINISSKDLSILLMRMEIQGLIRSIKGNKYTLL